jgi:K+-sensing histidine kinase KdpD
MALAICRSIIEAHEGRLSAVPGRAWGGLAIQISLLASAIGAAQKIRSSHRPRISRTCM